MRGGLRHCRELSRECIERRRKKVHAPAIECQYATPYTPGQVLPALPFDYSNHTIIRLPPGPSARRRCLLPSSPAYFSKTPHSFAAQLHAE